MSAAVMILAIAVAVLTVLVAGLLRSHAVILRRLHELGSGAAPELAGDAGGAANLTGEVGAMDAAGDAGAADLAVRADLADRTGASGAPFGSARLAPVPDLPQPPSVAEGRPAADLAGAGPRGEAIAVRVAGTAHDTIVVFLSSGCETCHAFWDDLRDLAPADDPRVVVVTKGEEAESPAAVADVAPRHLTVLMSSAAWEAYAVPGSPYVVHVDGPSGRVRGEGTGPNWAQVGRMLDRGAADVDARRGTASRAAADARREADVDRMLRAAGIAPGDPSLYRRADGTSVGIPDGGEPTP